jgi:YD repeat-containing protein
VVTDPLGRATGYTYDANDNVTRTTDAAGRTTTAAYDKNNRLTSSTDQLGKTTTADGNLISRTSPLGHKSSWTYDGDGRKATAVDPRGNATGADPAQYTTTYGYDPAGNPTEVTDPLGGVATTAYDALGKVIGRKDADGRTTSYGYDDLDRLTEVTAPDGAVTAYGYDRLGNLTERTDANGHVSPRTAMTRCTASPRSPTRWSGRRPTRTTRRATSPGRPRPAVPPDTRPARSAHQGRLLGRHPRRDVRLRRRRPYDCPRQLTTCLSKRISSTRERFDSTPIRGSPGPGNASRTEIRIPAISICSRMNCTSRTGCVSTATRTVAAPIRRSWTPATPGTNMRPRRTV